MGREGAGQEGLGDVLLVCRSLHVIVLDALHDPVNCLVDSVSEQEYCDVQNCIEHSEKQFAGVILLYVIIYYIVFYIIWMIVIVHHCERHDSH